MGRLWRLVPRVRDGIRTEGAGVPNLRTRPAESFGTSRKLIRDAEGADAENEGSGVGYGIRQNGMEKTRRRKARERRTLSADGKEAPPETQSPDGGPATLYDDVGSVKRHLELTSCVWLVFFLLKGILFFPSTKARS